MKKKSIIFILSIVFPVLTLTAQTDGVNLGLINYLAQVKYQNELKLAQGLHSKDSVKIVQNYYEVYVTLNSFISQLEADMYSSNSLKTYNRLDKLLKNNDINNCSSDNKIIQEYIDKLKQLSPKQPDKSITTVLTTVSTVLDLTNKGVGIYKEIQEVKTTKISKICTILESVRLTSSTKGTQETTTKSQ